MVFYSFFRAGVRDATDSNCLERRNEKPDLREPSAPVARMVAVAAGRRVSG
jgi:hypothetical protein